MSHYPASRGFEIAISPDDLAIKGHCHILEKQSTSGFQEYPQIEYPDHYVKSNQIIQTDQFWCLEFKWTVFGPLACLLDSGYWKANAFFEFIGGGETSFSPEAIVNDRGVPGQHYESRLEIRPGELEPGTYRVVCCLQYHFKNGRPGPIVGFDDKGIVKIYEDKGAPHRPYPFNAELKNNAVVTE